jgi:hypothetical protein
MPAIVRPRRSRRMTLLALARRKIQQFGPYKCLALLLVPLLIVEPLKIAGLAFVSLGHWAAGACVVIGAYAASLLIIDRLYRVAKSKLMTMNWFAALVTALVKARGSVLAWLNMDGRERNPDPSAVTNSTDMEPLR